MNEQGAPPLCPEAGITYLIQETTKTGSPCIGLAAADAVLLHHDQARIQSEISTHS
jgi:hypothetical protein